MSRKKIKLAKGTPPDAPKTFEEWCEIHGEPEYIGEKITMPTNGILIEDCEVV